MENHKATHYRCIFNGLYKECEDLYRCSAKFLNISVCAMWVLSVLVEQEKPLTQRRLCEQLSQPKQTINSTIANLEKQELVHLLPVSGNRKEKQVMLTEKGIQYANQKIKPFINAEQELFIEMGEKDCDEYLRLTQKYITIYRKKIAGVLQNMEENNNESADSII